MALNNASGDSSKVNQDGKDQFVQEYVVRIPKMNHKRYSVMRFNSSLNIDVSKWAYPKMERENNLKEFKADEDVPKYGAGSEFGRDQRDEARRKKYGIVTKKYNPDEQPWILKIGGKGGKKFKGVREGGVTENASYYVFTQAPDGTFEAFPIEEWYNFSPIHCYKALSAEEAEEEFVRRDKVLNFFKIMRKKRQKDEGDGDDEDESEGKGKNSKVSSHKEFKISDADDWINDSDDSDENASGDNDDNDDEKSKKKNSKKTNNSKKSKKKEPEEEALEESDEGDFDDREVDYITNSSSSGEEPEDEKTNRELKGVEDEDALRKIDASGDEEEEENKETEENPEAKEKPPEPKPPKQKQKKEKDSSDDETSESDDSDFDDSKFQSAMFMQKTAKKKNGSDNSASSSRANTPTRFSTDVNKEAQRNSQKRKLIDSAHSPASKKNKQDAHSSAVNFNPGSADGITEDAIRRYLSRKPMTATDLLQKFKSKKTGMNSEQLANKIAGLLKKVNPHRQQIKSKMYFSLKP